MKIRKARRAAPTVPLASMGDIAFLLTIFFILTSNFAKDDTRNIKPPTARELERFVCGANRMDAHCCGASWEELAPLPEVVDLRAAQPGDRCVHDPSQRLEASRGIEVGHIFQLGRKYSEALDARFTNEAGSEEALWMGCYGIGVSRLAQAAVEQHHDDHGICWPVAIAPFEVIVVPANVAEPAQLALAEQLYTQIGRAHV